MTAAPRSAALGAIDPLVPALVSPPQYRPAQSTVAPEGSDSVARMELNIPPGPSTSTKPIVKSLSLIFVAAVPARPAAQDASASGQVISVLPMTAMSPKSFVA